MHQQPTQRILLPLCWLLCALLWSQPVQAKPPIANILPMPKQPPNRITLDGSASRDPDGTPLTFAWTLLQGPPPTPTLATPDKAKTTVILRTPGTYRFQLIVQNKAGERSPPATLDLEIDDLAPFAQANAPLVATVQSTVQLDGSQSADANNTPLAYAWRQALGPFVILQDPTSATPSFKPTKAGLYAFELVVSDAKQQSQPARLQIVVADPKDTTQQPPHAKIIAPASSTTQTPIRLNGSRSRSFTQTPLSYQWTLLQGPDTTILDDPQDPQPIIRTTKPGSYLFQLIVSDTFSPSPPSTHRIEIAPYKQQLPTARVQHTYAAFETIHTLDASKSTSTDPEIPLTYQWTQIAGPPVTLRNPTSPKPSFFVLNRSTYRFQVIVTQDELHSTPQIAQVSVNTPPNKPPNAKLSAPTTPLDATKATPLDGTKSQDPEGKPLSYQWTQIAGPPAFIENPNTAKPNLIPLSYGFITLALTVSDGTTQSLPSTVQLSVHDAQNHVPIANAGDDQEVLAGVKVTLDGTQSQDLDPTDTLSYTWTQIAPDPTEEPVQLSGQSAPKALFFIPSNTDIRSYTFGLIVDDGKISSLQDTVQIKVIGVNKAPKSIPNAPESARVNDTVTLDGTQSKDPNPSDTLSYTWRQTGGAKTSLRNVQSPKASFTPALPGTYAFALTVSDGTLSHNDTVTILVQQPPAPPSQGCQSIPQPLAHFPLLALFFLLLLSKTSRI